ncbi:Ig-like domain-containing protein [Microvirga sp. VF16]|uniref:Ig-like domain-containing protein n=1 Tax=Microvirga sp. VF16 TaxID=2807101 RepID=UPI00193D3315|nr:Ig-like domain-containing protein [Microvirga sp. VF16]QRM31158.1 cadherin-like domain-containing protein [Microvirga sp. VF16]
MSQMLIDAFNAATTWQQALAAIKNEEYASLLLEDTHRAKLNQLPDDAGREQAIGLGVTEIKTLFGDFTTVDEIRSAVQKQIDVEYAKFEVIEGVRTANGVGEMRDALNLVPILNEHRQNLIEEWSASEIEAVQARVAALEAEEYTLVLKEIASRAGGGAYLDLLAAKLVIVRDDPEADPIFGTGTLIPALKAADLAVNADILAAFNEADTWQEALAAINAYEILLLDEVHLDKLDDLPDGQGREQAIGLGLNQTKALFGNFQSIADLKEALEYQIDTEHAKFEFITALDAAATEAEMTAAIKATIQLVNTHRQDLIADLLASEDPDAIELAGVLQQSAYTTVLAEIVTHLNDNAYMAQLGARMLSVRNALEGGQFFGDSKIIPALAEADGAIDAVVTAFNEADSWQEALAAIKDNASVLLDEAHLSQLDDLPDNQGREQAIGLGVLEIKTLFGDFTSLDTVIVEVRYQIEVEHTKFAALNAINAATEENMVAVLKEHIGKLHDHRQELIEKWSASTDPDARERAEELSHEDYTLVLAEIVSHFDDATYMAGLAETILDAEHFSGVGALITALRAADVELDSPVAGATQNVTTDEDTVIVQDIGATDPNGDTLTYSVKSGAEPQKGKVTFAGGKFTYTPAKDVNGTDTFTIVISDGEHSIDQTVTVTINAVNDAPADITLSNSKVSENSIAGTPVGQLTATDLEGGAMKFALLDDAGGRFKLETKDGVTSLVVADGLRLDYEQAAFHTVRVQVTDSDNKTYEETLTIDLTDVAGEKITGTTGTDVLAGGTGKDVFNGGLGNDKLSGGLGNDTLTGGKGKDTFVFDSKLGTSSTDRKVNFDAIKDFSVKDDSLYLDNAIFKKLGSGTEAKPKQLSKSFFTIGDKAKDKNDYLIYNNKTGVLSYDADGSGKSKAVEFAQLSKNLKMTYKDFFVI